MLTVNFSMSIRQVYVAFVDEDTVTLDTLQIIWSNVQCANSYVIYRNGQYLAEVSTEEEIDDRYTDTAVVPGEKYIYQVASKYSDENQTILSDFKNTGEITTPEPVISPEQGFQLLQ